MFRHFRNVVSHSRIPFKIDAAASKDGGTVRRVRFLKSRSALRGRPASVFYMFATVFTLSSLAIPILVAADMAGHPVFIPISLPELEKRQQYLATDPAVKAYVDFINDSAKMKLARKVFEEKAIDAIQRSIPKAR